MARPPPLEVNTIIIGGGHCGVNLACLIELDHRGDDVLDYLIVERAGELLDKWRRRRWDHFQINTPVRCSRLHGQVDGREDWLLDRPIGEGEFVASETGFLQLCFTAFLMGMTLLLNCGRHRSLGQPHPIARHTETMPSQLERRDRQTA